MGEGERVKDLVSAASIIRNFYLTTDGHMVRPTKFPEEPKKCTQPVPHSEILQQRGCRLLIRHTRRQFHDPDVSHVDLAAFGFQADVAFFF